MAAIAAETGHGVGRAGVGGWRALAAVQGVYYLVTGVWPLVSMRAFEAVTGPKTDDWLVRLVGLMVAVLGGVLVWEARRGRLAGELAAVGLGFAVSLGGVGFVTAVQGRISAVYLADAGVEAVIAAWWGWVIACRGRLRRGTASG